MNNWLTWVLGIAIAVALGLGIFNHCGAKRIGAVSPAAQSVPA